MEARIILLVTVPKLPLVVTPVAINRAVVTTVLKSATNAVVVVTSLGMWRNFWGSDNPDKTTVTAPPQAGRVVSEHQAVVTAVVADKVANLATYVSISCCWYNTNVVPDLWRIRAHVSV